MLSVLPHNGIICHRIHKIPYISRWRDYPIICHRIHKIPYISRWRDYPIIYHRIHKIPYIFQDGEIIREFDGRLLRWLTIGSTVMPY
jgi:hypothetical protein